MPYAYGKSSVFNVKLQKTWFWYAPTYKKKSSTTENILLLQKIASFIEKELNNFIKSHVGSFSVFIPASLLQKSGERALLDGALGFDIVSGLELWQHVKY